MATTAKSFGSAFCVRSAYQSGRVGAEDDIEKGSFGKFCDKSKRVSSAGYKVRANLVCMVLSSELYSNLTRQAVLSVAMGWNSNKANSNVNADVGHAPAHPMAASTALIKFLSRASKSANRAEGVASPHSPIDASNSSENRWLMV